jgi:predicted Rossmann-fold nucleotide-binding protein
MAELGISAQNAEYYSIGMIDDMLTERANDHEKYNELATQDDFDKF